LGAVSPVLLLGSFGNLVNVSLELSLHEGALVDSAGDRVVSVKRDLQHRLFCSLLVHLLDSRAMPDVKLVDVIFDFETGFIIAVREVNQI